MPPLHKPVLIMSRKAELGRVFFSSLLYLSVDCAIVQKRDGYRINNRPYLLREVGGVLVLQFASFYPNLTYMTTNADFWNRIDKYYFIKLFASLC